MNFYGGFKKNRIIIGYIISIIIFNLYTDRHYDTNQELFELFEEERGIKVNVIIGKSDELIERLAREEVYTEANLLITADAERFLEQRNPVYYKQL